MVRAAEHCRAAHGCAPHTKLHSGQQALTQQHDGCVATVWQADVLFSLLSKCAHAGLQQPAGAKTTRR